MDDLRSIQRKNVKGSGVGGAEMEYRSTSPDGLSELGGEGGHNSFPSRGYHVPVGPHSYHEGLELEGAASRGHATGNSNNAMAASSGIGSTMEFTGSHASSSSARALHTQSGVGASAVPSSHLSTGRWPPGLPYSAYNGLVAHGDNSTSGGIVAPTVAELPPSISQHLGHGYTATLSPSGQWGSHEGVAVGLTGASSGGIFRSQATHPHAGLGRERERMLPPLSHVVATGGGGGGVASSSEGRLHAGGVSLATSLASYGASGEGETQAASSSSLAATGVSAAVAGVKRKREEEGGGEGSSQSTRPSGLGTGGVPWGTTANSTANNTPSGASGREAGPMQEYTHHVHPGTPTPLSHSQTPTSSNGTAHASSGLHVMHASQRGVASGSQHHHLHSTLAYSDTMLPNMLSHGLGGIPPVRARNKAATGMRPGAVGISALLGVSTGSSRPGDSAAAALGATNSSGGSEGPPGADSLTHELKLFHKRHREMLQRVGTVEVKNERLARDVSHLFEEVARLQQQQTAVGAVLQTALADLLGGSSSKQGRSSSSKTKRTRSSTSTAPRSRERIGGDHRSRKVSLSAGSTTGGALQQRAPVITGGTVPLGPDAPQPAAPPAADNPTLLPTTGNSSNNNLHIALPQPTPSASSLLDLSPVPSLGGPETGGTEAHEPDADINGTPAVKP